MRASFFAALPHSAVHRALLLLEFPFMRIMLRFCFFYALFDHDSPRIDFPSIRM